MKMPICRERMPFGLRIWYFKNVQETVQFVHKYARKTPCLKCFIKLKTPSLWFWVKAKIKVLLGYNIQYYIKCVIIY